MKLFAAIGVICSSLLGMYMLACLWDIIAKYYRSKRQRNKRIDAACNRILNEELVCSKKEKKK